MSTARRDQLVQLEVAAQKKWAEEKVYELDAGVPSATSAEEKFFVTFPYPYMNGRLHLGHGFSLTKSEFATRFMRAKGRRALWPFGLHVTGTPIAACAQKLTNELRTYGNPPNFPDELLDKKKEEKEVELGKHASKRGKVAAPKPQWIIMKGMGIPEDEIANFADARHWLNYFPPRALTDLKKFGCHVDYRRSFITTKENPYYNSFVEWQFRRLREQGLLQFGKRYSIYSPTDGQPCADHDRASGEGVQPQEYTVVKLKVLDVEKNEGLKPFLSTIGGKDVILPGATLRAETVVGQTNVWVSPTVTYKAFEVTTPDCTPQIYLMTQKCARNMAYQNIAINGRTNYDPEPLFEIDGGNLVGAPIKAPHSPYSIIYCLPMATITESKGTGVVMSVPSDSPDDYINYMQFCNKPDYRTKLGIKDEWVVPFPVVPIINIPGEYGIESAKVAITNLKIQGPKDTALLEEAKKLVYQQGFYQGEMIIGPFKGEKVSQAKLLMAKRMYEDHDAIRYYEPMKQVMSRSGDECVVALCDQWFIRYGEEDWKKHVTEHVSKVLETYFPGIRNGFNETLEWLAEWPCSRTFGLGTELPFDDSRGQLIDSLSDSTIYMAYYTVALFLHAPADGESLNLDGRCPNKYGITPPMMEGDAPWNYVFKGIGTPESVHAATGLPVDIAEKMRQEFLYWYPVDLRVSGKDLIQNHLTMFLYNHAAVWKEDPSKWPRSIYCNGHVLVNNEKMSKSLGNFITLEEALERYGTDPTRLALADAGDSLDDANFVTDTAEGFVLKLTAFLEMAKERMTKLPTMRQGEFNLYDRIFENMINMAIIRSDNFFSKMQFRSGLNAIFFEFLQDESKYKMLCGDDGPHAVLARRFLEVFSLLICPLAPHFAESVWSGILENPGAAVAQRFPTPSGPISYAMLYAAKLIEDVAYNIRKDVQKNMKKRGTPAEVHVYCALDYLDWQQQGLQALRKIYEENNKSFPKDTIKMIQALKEPWMNPKNMQEVMAFLAYARTNCERFGPEALEPKPAMSDAEVIQAATVYICTTTAVTRVIIHDTNDTSIPEHEKMRKMARPGEPTLCFPK